MRKKYKLEVIHDDIQFLVDVIHFQKAVIKRVTAIQKKHSFWFLFPEKVIIKQKNKACSLAKLDNALIEASSSCCNSVMCYHGVVSREISFTQYTVCTSKRSTG